MVTGLPAVIKWPLKMLVVIVRPSAFMSPTNANCRLQQMQTALSNKYKLPSHANVLEFKWRPRQCNSKAFCHFYGIKSVLLSAAHCAQVTHKISFMRKDLGAVAIRATFWKEV